MGTLTTSLVLPSGLKPFSISQQQSSLFIYTRTLPKKHQSIVPVARLFGPAIFEASKLKVLFLGTDEKKHPGKLPRTYTLTHCDLTSKLTLAISQTINNSQVLKAFVHGDGNLFNNYPELEESLVWVYFHSTFPEFNKVECWGPLKAAAAPSGGVNRAHQERSHEIQSSSCDPLVPHPCQEDCTCCFPPMNMHVHDSSLV
ncbi:hypothetical protein TEA_014161 [Camellia sinensis var. sinensis]|uniref:Staygreen protein domain-containing protein n=1 Tax=Camellia sinensis var. sinensis TaxID=542762 RepID=A0A4S4DTV5_CAMSN|nr:hypothetical protein TEA_014161 [Camellia sinensis var. sinensis]